MSLVINGVRLTPVTVDPVSPDVGTIWLRGDRQELYLEDANGPQIIMQRGNIATTSPAVGDDVADDYRVGAEWVDTDYRASWICVDESLGAAVWVPGSQLVVSDATSGSQSLTTTYASKASIEPGPGRWLIEASLWAEHSSSDGNVEIGISIDASTTIIVGSDRRFQRGNNTADAELSLHTMAEAQISAGQTLDLMARESGANGTVNNVQLKATLIGMQ